MKFVRLPLIVVLLILQSACLLSGALPRGNQSVTNKNPQQTKPTRSPNGGPAYSAYFKEARQQWEHNNYVWLETEATRVRIAKERLPGGYWKLRVLHRAIERVVAEESSDKEWKEYIGRLETWTQQRPASLMARVLLANAWETYAWKARGHGFANTVEREDWVLFDERLEKANNILSAARALDEKSPEWYLAAQIASLGRGIDRTAYEELYEEGVALEPTYFHLQEAKACYLLPQWYGERGEWERFAEEAANRVGGEQGDIILFNIYAAMMPLYNLEFMNKHKAIAPRLIAGFRAIDRLYGSSPETLNEACLMSFSTDDSKTPAELMKRIGNDYDLSVWRDDSTFNVFRQEALKRSGEEPRWRPRAGSQKLSAN